MTDKGGHQEQSSRDFAPILSRNAEILLQDPKRNIFTSVCVHTLQHLDPWPWLLKLDSRGCLPVARATKPSNDAAVFQSSNSTRSPGMKARSFQHVTGRIASSLLSCQPDLTLPAAVQMWRITYSASNHNETAPWRTVSHLLLCIFRCFPQAWNLRRPPVLM